MDVTGLAYDQYMSTHVLKPMGMNQSFYGMPDRKDTLLATGYRYDGKEVEGKIHVYPQQAAASLWTIIVMIQ